MKFEDFDFGSRYDDAHLSKINQPDNISKALCDWASKPKGILFFISNPGVGKTYFCAAMCRDILEKKKNVRYMQERKLYQKMREVIQNGWDYEQELRRLCEVEFFILDDIGSTQMTDFQKEVLFNFLDYRYTSNLPTIITSNIWIREMGDFFSPRFISRVKDKNNLIIEINGKDKRQE